MTFKTIVKTVITLSVAVVVLVVGLDAYVAHRYGKVKEIAVSKLSDVDEAFEVGASSLKVRNPEFRIVCLVGDYVDSLAEAKTWLAPNDAEFMPALEAAGGLADTFNDEGEASIVLLSHMSALILKLDYRTGFSVANLGCASVDASNLEIRKSKNYPSGKEFYLPNATVRSTRGR
jgi:hypothetical protein